GLNAWCGEFADEHPEVLRCATLYPEDGVTEYVGQAVRDGAQLVKVHVTVSDTAPDDERLGGAWELLARAGVPVVIHAGHGPKEGRFSGPERVEAVLADHPGLTL